MHRPARAAIAAILMLAFAAPAAAAKGYRTIDAATALDDPGQVEVFEFFWYGCPHCYRFAPLIAEWEHNKPEGVEFRHIPAVLGPSWEIHARAFYAAKVLGHLGTFHPAMFRAMHEDKRRMDDRDEIRALVTSLGLDGDEFVETMSSFAVDSRLRRARKLQRSYGISGTPSVVIDGRYVTSGGMAGSFERMLRIIDDRVAAARRGAD